MKQELKPQVIGKGIVIDDILYKPVEADGDPWDCCAFCDCEKQCFSVKDISYCASFEDGTMLNRIGKITAVTIEDEPDQESE